MLSLRVLRADKSIERNTRKEIVLALSSQPSGSMVQRRWERRSKTWRRSGKREWEAFCAANQKMDVSVHLALQSPIFAMETNHYEHGAKLTVNPCLNDMGFGKIHDAVSTFQMIAQYLGNDMAVQMDPNPKISDVLKAHSAGFDKWSFRKHKDDPI